MIKKLLRIFIVLVFITGFITAYNSFSIFHKTSGSNLEAKGNIFSMKKGAKTFNITIIGDSLAKGTGDEKGHGISTYLPQYLNNKIKQKISINNAGVNGLKSDGLLEQLKSGKLDSSLSSCDLIVVSIGGNDILSLQNVDDKNKYEAFMQKQDKYQYNLKESFTNIREINPNAYIAVVGLYNPRKDAFSQLNSMILGVWNRGTQKIVDEDARTVFVPTNDLFKSNLDEFISSDSLHPNSAGYKAITERIISTIENN